MIKNERELFDYIYTPYDVFLWRYPKIVQGSVPFINHEQGHRYWDGTEKVIAIKPDNYTKWFVLDIDKDSKYRTAESIQSITDVLYDQMGIDGYLVLESSSSGGLHIWYLLPHEVHSHTLAVALAYHLTKAGFEINAGQLELFPNVRGYDYVSGHPKMFNRIRMLGQQDQYLLDNYTLDVVSPVKPVNQVLLHSVNKCLECNEVIDLPTRDGVSEMMTYLRSAVPEHQEHENWKEELARLQEQVDAEGVDTLTKYYFVLKKLGWIYNQTDEKGTTNMVIGIVTHYVVKHMEVSDPIEAEKVIRKIVTGLPGYKHCAKPESKEDIERDSGWCYRWARSKLNLSSKRSKRSKTTTTSKQPSKTEMNKIRSMKKLDSTLVKLHDQSLSFSSLNELAKAIDSRKIKGLRLRTLKTGDYWELIKSRSNELGLIDCD